MIKILEISDNKLADYRRETQPQTNAFRTKIEIFEQEKQAKDLTAIAVRKEIRQDNQILQTAFFELRNQTPPKEPERLDDTWCEFFSQHGRKESKLTLDEKLEELGKTFAP